MKKVFVTGAGGFVGQYVVEEFAHAGYEVTALLRQESDMFCHLSDVKLKISDLNTLQKETFYEKNYDALLHFAWEGSAGAARSDCTIQMRNIETTLKAVELSAEIGCQQFIYAGSVMEWEYEQFFINGNQKPPATSLYAGAKLSAHRLAKSLCVGKNIDFKTGIISNAYGVGELTPRLINSTLRKLMAGEETSFSAGEQPYDFMYVTDIAKGFRAVLEEGSPWKSYYLGNSQQKPLKDFLSDLRDCVNPDLSLGLGMIPFLGSGLDYSCYDCKALYEDTTFQPEIDFKTGILKTISWLQEEKNGI